MHILLAVVALKTSLEVQNQEFKFILFYVKSETSLGNIKLSQTNKKPKP